MGSEPFAYATQATLGFKGYGRKVVGADGSYELRESQERYTSVVGHENDRLTLQNGYFWNDPVGMSVA